MLIKNPDDVKSSEITDKKAYLDRRAFMKGAALVVSAVATGGIYKVFTTPGNSAKKEVPRAKIADVAPAPAVPKIDEAPTSLYDISHYNNFYEFSTDKREVADLAAGFVTTPWSVSVEGLVAKPKVFDLDDLVKLAPQEERIYRLRCVEGWSMVIPWVGFPLAKLLDAVQPLSTAKFVAFQTLLDPKRMPGERGSVLDWPYVEGLRLDEALNQLAILATGIYGETLPPQDGAPIRLVVPWKYGFKSIKSIVGIKLVDKMPRNTWNEYAPNEYGFYSNVNPNVDHPRWSQATERRIGEYGRRNTLMFNGYGDQVASLYNGMDLRVNY